MARYKNSDIEEGQSIFLTVNLKEQLLLGTFEYMLNDLVGRKIDVSTFDENYKNDKTGSKAIPPEVLIKLIIYGYYKGIKSSRKISDLSKENVIAKALTGDMEMHWTTIADFITRNSEKFKEIFIEVLAYCAELNLIGGETFAGDGRRMSSNASLDMSGTKEELQKRLLMYKKMADKHVAKHMKRDVLGELREDKRNYEKRQKHLKRQIDKISDFLDSMKTKEGKNAEEIKSNVTDNESAMIYSSKGFIQGYIGLAVADKKNQIIVNAQAVGTANEGEHLPELIDNTLSNLKEAGVQAPEGKKPVFMGDANYFSEENLRACEERGVEAVIPDSQYNRRLGGNKERRFEAGDFTYDKEGDYYICPYGKRLEYKRTEVLVGTEGKIYEASAKDCGSCLFQDRCLRAKKHRGRNTRPRKIMITKSSNPNSYCVKMRKKLASEEYQNKYAHRIQIIEPVFANITHCKGLDRLTLRGRQKVNGQWNLYCIVHNLGKCLNGYNKKRKAA